MGVGNEGGKEEQGREGGALYCTEYMVRSSSRDCSTKEASWGLMIKSFPLSGILLAGS